MIGATALTHGAGILTEKGRDFRRIPDVVVRRPIW
jgi:predicted nucleic acid-binding protein